MLMFSRKVVVCGPVCRRGVCECVNCTCVYTRLSYGICLETVLSGWGLYVVYNSTVVTTLTKHSCVGVDFVLSADAQHSTDSSGQLQDQLLETYLPCSITFESGSWQERGRLLPCSIAIRYLLSYWHHSSFFWKVLLGLLEVDYSTTSFVLLVFLVTSMLHSA